MFQIVTEQFPNSKKDLIELFWERSLITSNSGLQRLEPIVVIQKFFCIFIVREFDLDDVEKEEKNQHIEMVPNRV